MQSEPAVRVLDAFKIYAVPGNDAVAALRGVSLDVRAGEMVALAGPSGCGKTTLLSIVGCNDVPTSGAVTLEGTLTSTLDDDALTTLRRDRVGTVFQAFNLLPTLNVRDNVAVPLILQQRGVLETDRRVAAALDAVGLGARAHAMPSTLSGGEAQRVAIARAIIHQPAIVLADEPTGNLDTASGAVVLTLLRRLADEGQAILLATHSGDAVAACDRVIRMRDGEISE
jgi:putative ABC transport system ATP-binding protein